MADFFAKGKNPINGYGGQDHGLKELWKGSNITTFNAQTVTIEDIDVSKYDAIVIQFTPWGSELFGCQFAIFDLDVLDNTTRYLIYNFSADGKLQRMMRSVVFTVTSSSVSMAFGNNNRDVWNTYGSATQTSTQENTKNIPYRILGLIHNS